MSPLDKVTSGRSGGLAGMIERLSRRVGSGDRIRDGVTRRGFFVGTAVAGSAMTVDPKGYALTPQTAYSTICGPGSKAYEGWTVFCCTINNGVNSCPPGSFAAGWWKAASSSWCCGGYQYIVDCNAQCTGCSSGCSGDHICDSGCWNCSCGAGSTATCDQRRVCCNAFRYGQCNTHVSCSGGVHCRVLSCVPPYKWENCTTTSLVDNRTAEHGAPCLEGCGPILSKYNAMGAQGSYLHASTGPERAVGDAKGGRYVSYQGGSIYWTSATGAHAMNLTIRGYWGRLGGTSGPLGYPDGDLTVPKSGAFFQQFEYGAICDTASTSMASVYGSSWTQWASYGLYSGYLGWPLAPRSASVNGGWVQRFEKGATCASRTTQGSTVLNSIYDRWIVAGRETGIMGYPTANRTVRDDGVIQIFQGGAICDPSESTPVFIVTGAIYTSWVGHGRETGVLGWPRTNSQPVTGGRWIRFQHGEIWERDGQYGYGVWGNVLTRWKAAGGVSGRYGWPTSNPRRNADGTYTQTFQGGTITA